jgi:[acyl-carrier-protein] S-malonyltransferase
LEPIALKAGASKVIPLAVAGAFHTELMAPAAAELERAIAETQFKKLELPVFSNVDAAPHVVADDFRSLLSRQLVGPVLWGDSLEAMIASGINGFMEVGTGRVLRGTIKRINRKIPTDGFGDDPAS